MLKMHLFQYFQTLIFLNNSIQFENLISQKLMKTIFYYFKREKTD